MLNPSTNFLSSIFAIVCIVVLVAVVHAEMDSTAAVLATGGGETINGTGTPASSILSPQTSSASAEVVASSSTTTDSPAAAAAPINPQQESHTVSEGEATPSENKVSGLSAESEKPVENNAATSVANTQKEDSKSHESAAAATTAETASEHGDHNHSSNDGGMTTTTIGWLTTFAFALSLCFF